MDRTERIGEYRKVIKSILHEYTRPFVQQSDGVDVVAVCDENTDTYSVINVGWTGERRTNLTAVLMRIVNGQIWVESDNTMYRFVDELLAHGIKHDEIVIGFHTPRMRQYTDFAVA
ncbi:MAG: element excision factor XisI family protein [Chloroflexota bacterium]